MRVILSTNDLVKATSAKLQKDLPESLSRYRPSRKIYKDTSCRRIALIILNIKYLKHTNQHSPHSLASVKDMHVEMLVITL